MLSSRSAEKNAVIALVVSVISVATFWVSGARRRRRSRRRRRRMRRRRRRRSHELNDQHWGCAVCVGCPGHKSQGGWGVRLTLWRPCQSRPSSQECMQSSASQFWDYSIALSGGMHASMRLQPSLLWCNMLIYAVTVLEFSEINLHSSRPHILKMTGRLGCRTMDMNVPLFCTLFGNRTAFGLAGEGGDHCHCTVEPSPSHIRSRTRSGGP